MTPEERARSIRVFNETLTEGALRAITIAITKAVEAERAACAEVARGLT